MVCSSLGWDCIWGVAVASSSIVCEMHEVRIKENRTEKRQRDVIFTHFEQMEDLKKGSEILCFCAFISVHTLHVVHLQAFILPFFYVEFLFFQAHSKIIV